VTDMRGVEGATEDTEALGGSDHLGQSRSPSALNRRAAANDRDDDKERSGPRDNVLSWQRTRTRRHGTRGGGCPMTTQREVNDVYTT
jgi:hypothetical protein